MTIHEPAAPAQPDTTPPAQRPSRIPAIGLVLTALAFLIALIPGAGFVAWIPGIAGLVFAIIGLVKSPKKTLGIVSIVLFLAGTIAGFVSIAEVLGSTPAAPTAAASHAAPAAASKPSAAAAKPTVAIAKPSVAAKTAAPTAAAPASDRAVFKVWGSGDPDVTYSSDTDNVQGTIGKTYAMKVTDSALYYAVSAQLQGSGDIHCSVTIGGVTATGHAVGGYNICQAQLNSDGTGGWQQ